MYSNFENLNQEKKEKILRACIQEFSEKGYDKASTNSIIREAGISKGILFHYFKSKQGLFFYIIDYCIQKMIEEYQKYPLTETKDIFRRFSELGVIKLKIAQDYPQIVRLFMEALSSSPSDMRSEIEKKYLQISKEFMPSFFADIDCTKFRKGVEPGKAVKTIMLFLGALGEDYLKNYKGKEKEILQDYDKILTDYMDYMEILKYGMYDREIEE
ncbi:transcriptional regulator [Desulfosporosinus orientis DSM 765]|uniref:Transcriptional regulator n=1 Tax=Desulfosporosinus orientis (strain ATCC 19365 / DSM 765 / NCIMB 8382 / VKM B-1628 / Singapore I) TaxID=768706 RepID=G7WC06_DESOD|nr:TetR/AcrR family transcriptional regulator [Desulfosporosinus orientis]AET69980.1 transcriptional regulator [Desulfosporosinus orientis DSM 765]